MLHRALFGLVGAIVLALSGSIAVAQSASETKAAAEAPASGEAKPERIYELRIYTTNPGKLPDLHQRFRDHTMKLFEKHGMENVIYWTLTNDFRDEAKDDTLVYLLAHKSKAAAEASWKAFLADPEWQAVAAKSEENGKILAKPPVAVFLKPTDFNPPDEATNGKSDNAARLFELRRYNDGVDRVPGTVGRFRDWEGELFRTSGIQTLGFWTTEDGTAFVYLLGHKDRPTADANWRTFFTGFRARGNAAKGDGGKKGGEAAKNADAEKSGEGKSADVAKSADSKAGGDAAKSTNKGGAQKGNRGGGIEQRWLVPTDYSPRK